LSGLAKRGLIEKNGKKPNLLWSVSNRPVKTKAVVGHTTEMMFRIGPFMVQASINSDGDLQLIANKEGK
jgi:hypothetical protein